MTTIGVIALALALGYAWAHALGLVLAALALVLGRLVFVYHHPIGPCRRCRARGLNPFSTGRRYGLCKRCHGSKGAIRWSSRLIHRAVRGSASTLERRKP